MSLDISLIKMKEMEVYETNITHNLNTMASHAGIYEVIWRPEELFEKPLASDLIEPLERGLAELKAKPDYFQQFNPDNDWGSYNGFVMFVEGYLKACKKDPDAWVDISR